jgi:hypothetical protein
MRSQPSQKSLFIVFIFLSILLIPACGGGSSGGGNPETAYSGGLGDSSFYLKEVYFGRPILDAAGRVESVVNPATIIAEDPITGLIKEGYPELLDPKDSMSDLIPLSLSHPPNAKFQAKVVPRNATLVLDFSRTVDPESLKLEGGMITGDSPLQVHSDTGDPLPLEVRVEKTRVMLNPVAGDAMGFPSSPVVFDVNGDPTSNPQGYLKIFVYSAGTTKFPVRSIQGGALHARDDYLGTPSKPIGFNPGNSGMDFMEFGGISFNGFLPDLNPPRIIREVSASGTADLGSTAHVIQDPAKTFVVPPNDGTGEWAGALLTLRPGEPFEEKRKVLRNTDIELYVSEPFDKPPAPGEDEYLLQRAEFFEPIPGSDPKTAVDPENVPKDHLDPEDAKNSDLLHFVFFEAWNENTQAWEPADHDPGPQGTAPVDPRWRLSIRFSEPMDVESFRPYETFYICNAALSVEDPCFDTMKPGRVTARDRNRVISFEPVIEDPAGIAGQRILGFGGQPKTLRLVIRVKPLDQDLYKFYKALGKPLPPDVFEDLVKIGVLGVNDLGGQPLGMPDLFFDLGSPFCVIHSDPDSPSQGAFTPAVDFKFEFNTKEAPAQENPEYGVIVHRFMGLPIPGSSGGVPLLEGLIFYDHPDKLYGPKLIDTSIGLNGYLSGHAVEFIEHVFDETHKPHPSSPFWPDRELQPALLGVQWPVAASLGCRVQQVYRNGEASPNYSVFKDTLLDLIGLSWAPIGGNVNTTTIEKMSIAISYSDVEPITTQKAGNPDLPNSGLSSSFRQNIMPYAQVMVVGTANSGSPYKISNSKLYKPMGGSTKYKYHPMPQFHTPFVYDSNRSLLIEYRTDPNLKSGVDPWNGCTFTPGIGSSLLPNFRVYTVGQNPPSNWVMGASNPLATPQATGVGSGSLWGDNSRYYMTFSYVKRSSRVEAPFLGAGLSYEEDAYFLNPVIDPPLTELPAGTNLILDFQVAASDAPGGLVSAPVAPDVDDDGNGVLDIEEVLNSPAVQDWNFPRFRAWFTANAEVGVVPVLDTVAIPYRIIEIEP